MNQTKTFTNDIIIGKSFFKNDKKENKVFFERSILNLMIINNYNENKKIKCLKKN